MANINSDLKHQIETDTNEVLKLLVNSIDAINLIQPIYTKNIVPTENYKSLNINNNITLSQLKTIYQINNIKPILIIANTICEQIISIESNIKSQNSKAKQTNNQKLLNQYLRRFNYITNHKIHNSYQKNNTYIKNINQTNNLAITAIFLLTGL